MPMWLHLSAMVIIFAITCAAQCVHEESTSKMLYSMSINLSVVLAFYLVLYKAEKEV